MKTIETSKGLFKIVEINSIAEGQYYVDTLSSYHYKLSEINEQQASGIVDYPILIESIQGGGDYETYYDYKLGRYTIGGSQVLSLETLLESNNIEITPNTYIFKV